MQKSSWMYPSDLTDEQWEAIKVFFARANPRGAPEGHERRRIVEAILYRLREGCRWRALPADFPPWSTVSYHFQAWQRRGVWQEAAHVLATAWRQRRLGRARRVPRHAILDSQSVKSAAEGEQRSFHGGKQIKGRSRHVAVDSQGSLLALRVTGAGRSDSVEAGAVMAEAAERYPSLESFTADQGYKAQAQQAACQMDRELVVAQKSEGMASK